MVQRRVEELRDARVGFCLLAAARRRCRRAHARIGLGLNGQRQAIEKLAHARRQRRRELVEGRAHILLERRRRQAFCQRPREVERAQLGEIEAGVVEAAKRLLLEAPIALAVVHVVEEREARFLQRFEIAADRPRRDAGARRHVVDGEMTRGFEIAQQQPLADDFSVARQGPPSVSCRCRRRR